MKVCVRICHIILISGIMLISSLPALAQIDKDFWDDQWKAFASVTVEECQSSLKYCTKVLNVNPNHPVINYLLARLNEQMGNRDEALKYLKKAAKLGYTSRIRSRSYVHPLSDPVFSALRKEEAFQEVIDLMRISDEPIHKSQIAFTVTEMRYKEGITYDPVEQMFYLGSDCIIYKVDHSGKCTVFTKEAVEDGLNWVNGVHVEPVRRTLWACSKDFSLDHAEIFKYDLSSGKLIKKYTSPSDGSHHFFNDLVIHPNGDIYISGTAIYRISAHDETLEIFSEKPIGTNGITLSEGGRIIYTACDAYGICRIDIDTKAFSTLTHDDNFNTHGIDGLYFKHNYLYAIHNTLISQVNRFRLNKDATHIEDCEYFEKNIPLYGSPTTGVIVDDYFYFIAGNNIEGVMVMKADLR